LEIFVWCFWSSYMFSLMNLECSLKQGGIIGWDNCTSNFKLKFWWWVLETINLQFSSKGLKSVDFGPP
jgi:hypothetical protein